MVVKTVTIRVPLRLRREPRGCAASALYLPSREPAELFALCAALCLDPWGRVYSVEGGFLVALEQPATGAVPGAIRLRTIADGMYVPADAVLVPALLDEEASGVARGRGLVFLHGGRVLEFDRELAIDVSELLHAGPRPRRAWSSLPAPEAHAERLRQVVLDLPDEDPNDIYREIRQELNRPNLQSRPSQPDGSGSECRGDEHGVNGARKGEEPGSETGEPLEAGAAAGEPGRRSQKSVGERAVHGVLRPLGAAISAMRHKIQWEWVDHSELVKKLVREFREGDKALALQRAIPIMRPGDGHAAWIPVRANWLPWTRAVYNLAELLRRPGRGNAIAVRMARDDAVRELMVEYRKAAEEAVSQGDFRRAAYIYGILLQDDRTAASALERAGLHHDAALIYANKLNDRAAAAKAFEAAGEFDRALDLFRGLGQHERAGDLLRRIGEEDAAVAEYVAAAYELSRASANHLGAGRILLQKAQRADLAIEEFRNGWQRRPAGNATQCGLELARLHAGRGQVEPFRRLLDEADAMFETPGYPFDGYFYNEIVRMADEPALEPIAEEVRDRALQATARSFRRGLESRRASGAMVSKLLGRSKLWPAALLSDADFAVRKALEERRAETIVHRPAPSGHSLQIGRGSVTAACQAAVSSEIFLGFESGLVCVFRPESEQVLELPSNLGTVVAISVDPQGQTLAALHASHRGLKLCCCSRGPDGSYRARPEIAIGSGQSRWLTPILPMGAERLLGISDGSGLIVVDAASGLARERLRIADDETCVPRAGVLLAAGGRRKPSASGVTVLTHDSMHWVVLDPADDRLYQTGCRWLPAETGAHALESVPLSCRHAAPLLELVGVDGSGAVHAAEFHVDERSVALIACRVATTDGGYVGAAHCGTSTIVGVSRTGIDWLSFHGDRFRLAQREECSLPSAIACFATHMRDALVVCSRGLLIRVPPPRRGVWARN
jgi:tetratricopeptide (TPR) repeat protein